MHGCVSYWSAASAACSIDCWLRLKLGFRQIEECERPTSDSHCYPPVPSHCWKSPDNSHNALWHYLKNRRYYFFYCGRCYQCCAVDATDDNAVVAPAPTAIAIITSGVWGSLRASADAGTAACTTSKASSWVDRQQAAGISGLWGVFWLTAWVLWCLYTGRGVGQYVIQKWERNGLEPPTAHTRVIVR